MRKFGAYFCALCFEHRLFVGARADGSIIPSIGIKVGGRCALELHVGRGNGNGEIWDIEGGLSMGRVKVCKDAWTVR